MTTAICDDPGPADSGEFAARVAAWEVELADDRVVARREAAALSAELAMEIAEDPALAVALGLAPDPDLLDDEDGDHDGRGDADDRGDVDGRSSDAEGRGDAEGRVEVEGGDADEGAEDVERGVDGPGDAVAAGPAAADDAGGVSGARTAVPDALVSDYALVARIAVLEESVARTQAAQVAAMTVLAHRSVFRRRDREDTPAAIRARVDGFEDRCHRAAVELSAALTVAPQTAARRLSVAVELVRDLPATLSGLRAGWLSLQLATLICDETRVLPPALRAVVEAQALAVAADCTPGQLERKLRSWVIAADPKGAAERYAAAKRDRRFSVTALPDGMALLKAVLTADGAQTVATAVDAVAAGMRHHPDGTRDERSVDQRRADALVGICADVLDAGHTGCGADRCGEGCTSTSATGTSGPTGADTSTDTSSPARSSDGKSGGRSGDGDVADAGAGATAASTGDADDQAADAHDDAADDQAADDAADHDATDDDPLGDAGDAAADDAAADNATDHPIGNTDDVAGDTAQHNPIGDDLDDAAADNATDDPIGNTDDVAGDTARGDPSGGESDKAAADGPDSDTQRGNDRGDGNGVRGDHEDRGGGHGPGGRGGGGPDDHGGHGPGDRGGGRDPGDRGGGGGPDDHRGGGGSPPGRGVRRRLARWHGHRPHIQVTVAASTLLGVDDLPAQLTGYGPITAEQARRIAADGTWRRLLTDPADGRLLEYGRAHRDPPQELADFVLARDVTDRFPTSLTPAHRCDLDHATAWDDGGTTGATNINAVSPRAHQVRHDTGWTVQRVTKDDGETAGDGDDGEDADQDANEARDRAGGGTLEWTSPTGHTYTTPPEQVGPVPGDRLFAALAGTTLHTGQHDDDPPPF